MNDKSYRPRVIWGIYTGADDCGTMEWEDPVTGEWKSCTGQFQWDDLGYYHELYEGDNATAPSHVVYQKNKKP